MKTLKIAGLGVAALGLAALPVAGVFADAEGDQQMSVTETVKAIVANTCGIYDSYQIAAGTGVVNSTDAIDKEYNKTMLNGELWNTGNGATYIVVCNDTGAWKVTAAGAGTGSSVEKMDASTNKADDDIATGGETSGPVANWAYKVTKSEDTQLKAQTSGISSFHAVPGTTGEVVVESIGATKESATFTTAYQVYIGTQTPAATYTGKVTYTLSHPAAS